MDSKNIDQAIKNIVDNAEGFYDKQASVVQEKIWQRVQSQRKKRNGLMLIRSLAAACILLLIVSSVLFISLRNTKKTVSMQAELNRNLAHKVALYNQNIQNSTEPEKPAKINLTDTVYIVKKETVLKPIETVRKVVDTVYVRQVVYTEKEASPESQKIIAHKNETEQEISEAQKVYNTEIFIRGNEQEPKQKGKKFRIRFGGNSNQTANDDGTLALSAKF